MNKTTVFVIFSTILTVMKPDGTIPPPTVVPYQAAVAATMFSSICLIPPYHIVSISEAEHLACLILLIRSFFLDICASTKSK